MIKVLISYAATVVLGLALTFAAAYSIPPPTAVSVSAPTEKGIKDGYKQDVKQKRIERAIQRSIATARAVYRYNGCRDIYSDITGRTAYEYGLSPRLLAAVVFVESGCRANAVSGRNSVGLMQINPRVWGHRDALYNPMQNLRLGASILSTYIKSYGLVEGLHRYNGLGNRTNSYAEKVLAVAQIEI